MQINIKVLTLVMFVMMICCVSAASAADLDNITVPDDTDVIEIDEAVDSVEEVEQTSGTATCDGTNCDCEIETPTLPTRSNSITVTPTTYESKFTNGVFNDASVDQVIFNGTFTSEDYKTLKFNQELTITATTESTFENIGFGLLHDGIVLNGITLTMNAPESQDCYAIDIENASDVIVINNKINYICDFDNGEYYNYAIKAVGSENLTIYGNEINATVPLKQPNWEVYCSIYSDYVAGVAIESCDYLNFAKNNLTVIGNYRVGGFPTLDAFIIANSANGKIRGNNIYESDIVTTTNQYSYIYGIDVYVCDNLTVCSNNVIMNGNISNTDYEGNGTGAAYCIQLTGPHTGIKICNNTLTTKNQGPNLGIYSQNYAGGSQLTICGNHINVTGKADTNPWALVSGMELQGTNATVYHNDIVVYNTNTYDEGNYVFGISYCQSTGGNHYYNITSNNVTVHNGYNTISILSGSTGYIGYNNLTAITDTTTRYGNSTVDAPISMIGPNYP